MNPNTGQLFVTGHLDYEALKSSKYQFRLNVLATDSNGNNSTRPIVVNVRDINEPSVLSKGQASLTDFNLYKFANASSYIAPLASDVTDPEGKATTYRISSGWLPDGLTLNAKTGVVSGRPTGANNAPYQFTITADDGVLNGIDASRTYAGTITSKNLLTATDSLLSASDANTTLTVLGSFASGGTLQLFKVGTAGAADSSVRAATTLSSASNTESASLVFSKTELIAGNSGTADFYVRYVLAGSTTNSILLNITRDDTLPSIVAIDLSSAEATAGAINAGDVVTASVIYSEAVQLTGTPSLNLNIGGTTRSAIYSSLNGATLTFTYTIQATYNDSNGISVNANSLILASPNKISDPLAMLPPIHTAAWAI